MWLPSVAHHRMRCLGQACWRRARRAASRAAGPADETGIKLESMVRAGLTYPVGEALAMYYQVPSQGPELSKYRPK